jgi:hypothetical protein
MSDSIKKLLGIKEEQEIKGMSGKDILNAAKDSGKISTRTIIEFNGHEITDEDKKSIVLAFMDNDTNPETMVEFMGALKSLKDIKESDITSKRVGRPPKDKGKDGTAKTKPNADISKKKPK